MATSVGTRDEAGAWTPVQARRVLEYTKSLGGRVAAAEFMNEPNFASIGGSAGRLRRRGVRTRLQDVPAFARKDAPDLLVLGPGSVGETAHGRPRRRHRSGRSRRRDLLEAAGPGVDGFSYHHYNTVSKRCTPPGVSPTAPEDALSEGWLARPDATLSFYKSLRDAFEPGKPIWLTETADAACGGNPWASSFIDTFRYLDQLGRLARQEVRVVAHNTLVASDYGMIDEHDLVPKPNYWAAVLWRRLMGTTVLDPGRVLASRPARLRALPARPAGRRRAAAPEHRQGTATDARASERGRAVHVELRDLLSRRADLNGAVLELGAGDALPPLAGAPSRRARSQLAPATITFLAVPGAANDSCR